MPIILNRRKKRYICTYVKLIDNQYKGNVVVVCAHNDVMAKAILCEQYRIPAQQVKTCAGEYKAEGIKSIRLAETNLYEGGSVHENFSDD
jgi:hypothetical protein